MNAVSAATVTTLSNVAAPRVILPGAKRELEVWPGQPAPLGRVMEQATQDSLDSRPNTPWHETVIYELHVKGFTQQHPDVPEKLRGTYAGLSSLAAIGHFRKLGITAIELLPVHYHIDEH